MRDILIIGAGPAGMSAAITLAKHGACPVVISDAPDAGGQGYRKLNPHIDLDPRQIYGPEYHRYESLNRQFSELLHIIDYRPSTLAWAIYGGKAHVLRDGQASEIPYRGLILAPGATDRIMPVPGWTLPGVFSLGAAQIALKDQGCFIGRKVVFAGSSPLLLLAALQYRRLGATDLAVLDTTGFSRKLLALAGMRHAPRTFAQGLSYMRELKALGVPVRTGVELKEIEGRNRVSAIRFAAASGKEHRIGCDAVALGHGLRSETQLAELAGCSFSFDPALRQWFPKSDENGRAGERLYVTGDGAGIGGAEAAVAGGSLAAIALLEELGTPVKPGEKSGLQSKVSRLRRFQKSLARAFNWPHEQAATLPDDVIVCRCENVTAGDIRKAAGDDLGPVEVNRMKAITRCGMGRCQGRFCGPALAEITAAAAGQPIETVGRLRAQAPVKPLPLSAARSEP
ncbi:MAG: FAD-dependent oxidoreductase [Rhodobiaceae bacterium]|nr:FAD-dependent oxidoreductase [Rhodobiaceae bacterium]MCC0048023.1 FAD-dependent oxidoreductase [Rhodobiaceae bacterium]